MENIEQAAAKCEAVIVFGDDHGDNDCTFHCKLEQGHTGPHSETGILYGESYSLNWAEEGKSL